MEEKMRTLFAKSLVKMALAAMAVSALLCQPAKAHSVTINPSANPYGSGAPVIEVESDGEEWTNIRSATRQLTLDVKAEADNFFRVTKVYVGVPSADFCIFSDGTPADENCDNVFSGEEKEFHKTLTHDFSTDNIGGIEAGALVDKCNAANYQGDPRPRLRGFQYQRGCQGLHRDLGRH
jgi:hypothetical protein